MCYFSNFFPWQKTLRNFSPPRFFQRFKINYYFLGGEKLKRLIHIHLQIFSSLEKNLQFSLRLKITQRRAEKNIKKRFFFLVTEKVKKSFLVTTLFNCNLSFFFFFIEGKENHKLEEVQNYINTLSSLSFGFP